MTVARLGYEIDSSGAVIAAKNLDDMAASAKRADNIADQLKISFDQMAGEIRAMTTTLNMSIKSMGGLSSAAQVSEKVIDSNTLAINELRAALAAMATQGSKPAQDETEKLGASLERLRSKYNPLYAASKQYEMALKEIAEAEKLGAINATQAAAAREKAAAGLVVLSNGADKAGKSLLGAGVNMRMLIPQLSQIGQQFTATGQLGQAVAVQAADIGLAFGVVGTVIGTIAGIALPSLIDALYDGEGAADNFKNALDELDAITSQLEGNLDLLALSGDELAEKYGNAASRVRQFAQAQAELNAAQAASRFREQITLLDEIIDRYAGTGRAGGVLAGVRELQRDLDVTQSEARELNTVLRAFSNASTFDEQQTQALRLLDALEGMQVPLSALPEDLRIALNEMINFSNETDRARYLMEQLASAAQFAPGLNPTMDIAGMLPTDRQVRGRPARRGGGGSRVDEFARDLEALRNSLRTEREVVDEWYMQQQEILANRRAMEILGIEGHNQAKLRLEQEYLDRLNGINTGYHGTALDQAQTFFGDMASALQGGNDKMIAAAQAFASVEALINAYRAYNQVIADPTLPWFAKIPAAVGVLSAGLKTVSAIKSLSGSSSGTSASAGVTATSSAPQAQQTRAIVSVQSGRSRFTLDEINDIVAQLQDQSSDGVIIEGFTRG